LGVLNVGLGRKEKAFHRLEKGFAEHDGSMVLLKVDPVLDPLRSDPKFVALLKRMRFANER
jgi:hypothetical protein